MGCNESEPQKIQQPHSRGKKYQKQQQIGKGTYGLVYRCIEVMSLQEYAMKVVKINSKTKEDAIKSINLLKTQISMLKKLNHPNIIKYISFDVSDDQQQVQIVLQLMKNGSLKDHLSVNGPLSQRQVARICKYILEALDYLHEQSIIHRDLKCANILITEDLIPKITDFGTAKIVVSDAKDDIAKISASLKGTPYYMAPQIIKRTGHNKSADIWSFGCMVIEMLSGKAPWTTINAKFQEIIGYISSGIHPPFPPNISKQCQYFLQSCLNPIASQRLKASELLKHRFILRKQQISSKQTFPRSSSKNEELGLTIADTPENKKLMKQETVGYKSNTTTIIHQEKLKPKYVNVDKLHKSPSNIIDDIDKIVDEIDELSEQDLIVKEHYHIKRRQTKKKKNQKNTTKTAGNIRNTEENILQTQNSYVSNKYNHHDAQIINTKIAAMEKEKIQEEQEKKKKLKEQNRLKWEQQLKQEAQLMKNQLQSRYV